METIDPNLEDEDVEERHAEDPLEEIREDEGEEENEMEGHEGSSDESRKRKQEYKYLCLSCFKRYKRKGHLVEHQRIFCGKDKQQHCPYCVFRTYKKSNLKKHVIRKHCHLFNYMQFWK